MSYYFDKLPIVQSGNVIEITEDICKDRYGGEVSGCFMESKEKRELLVAFIKCFYKKTRGINKKSDSYYIKGQPEKFLGFYISNSDMKAAMLACGFYAYDVNALNWTFNVSSKSLNLFDDLKCDLVRDFGLALNNYVESIRKEGD